MNQCIFSDEEDEFTIDDEIEEEITLTGNIPTNKELAVLETNFGHREFRPLQWKIINTIITENRDVCAVIATGYGKSLCYQYPPIYKNGISIVISPLISLMEDQVLSLKISNISACFLGSAQTRKNAIIKEIIEGKYKIIYATPEYITGDNGMADLHAISESNRITLLAIDEAHCVSNWGHDFRPQYRSLWKIRNILLNVPILAVTATATAVVQEDIIKVLKLRNPVSVCSSFDRPNLYFAVKLKSGEPHIDIKSCMNNLGNSKHNGSTIIYCLTQKSTEAIYRTLLCNGIKCVMYHAGLSISERRQAHEEFITDKVKCIVATIAFGMGIDKPDVRNVIHYGASKDVEGYYQEVGRAGRDGFPAKCTLFFSSADFTIHENIREKNTSKSYKTHLEHNSYEMDRYINTTDCRRKFILKYFNDQICNWNNLKPRKNCCDNCLKQLNAPADSVRYENVDENGTYDLTEDAKLFLQSVKNLNGKFGIGKYCLLLKGSKSSGLPVRFQKLNIFGKGNHQPLDWWKIVGRILTNEGYLMKTHNKNGLYTYSTLSLSQKGITFLSVENSDKKIKIIPPLDMQKYVKVKIVASSVKTSEHVKNDDITSKNERVWMECLTKSQTDTSTSSKTLINIEDPEEKKFRMELYYILLDVRNNLALKENCSPFLLASNVALMNMSKSCPRTMEEFKSYKFDGMSEGKISKYGQIFLDSINNFSSTKFLNITKSQKTDNSPKLRKEVGISNLRQFAFVENKIKITNDSKSQSSTCNNDAMDELSDSALNNMYDHFEESFELDGKEELQFNENLESSVIIPKTENNIEKEHTLIDLAKPSTSNLNDTTLIDLAKSSTSNLNDTTLIDLAKSSTNNLIDTLQILDKLEDNIVNDDWLDESFQDLGENPEKIVFDDQSNNEKFINVAGSEDKRGIKTKRTSDNFYEAKPKKHFCSAYNLDN